MLRLCVCVCVVVGGSYSTLFQDCGQGGGKIISVDLVGYQNYQSVPYKLKQGTNYTVHIIFKANKEIREATTVVHGILKGVPVPFPLPDDNACHFMSCPISAGTTIVYSAPFECKESYPEMELQVKWEVKDENRKSFICFEIPIEIIA